MGQHRAGGAQLAGDASVPIGTGGAPAAAPGAGGEAVDHLPIGQIGGNFAEPMGGAAPISPPQCDPDASWGHAMAIEAIDTEADERLLAMAPDELTLVFARDEALFVVDRWTVAAEFANATALMLPSGYDADRGLALTANGLSLVLVSDDGAAFAEISRVSRQVGFRSQPNAARFAAVNDARTFSGGELSSPAISEDGKTFFYVEQRGGRSDVWRATGAALDERTKLDSVTLGGDEGMAKLTLSVSTDERALFVFDEALGHAVSLWSTTPAGAFTQAVPLPDLESAFANADCSRLYGTRASGPSLDIVIESP